MSNGWFEDGFDIFHSYDENVLIKPETTLFVPARINLKATIASEKRIKSNKGILSYILGREHTLFWDENLISKENKIYVFKTKYCNASDEILSLENIDQIPKRLNKKFLKKTPQRINDLANKLIGEEKDSIRILRKFYEFVYEHIKHQSPTTGKPLDELLDEYEKYSYFYGNCKEARDFYCALCNAKEYPTKKVLGKCLDPGAHVWADVFVPTNNGYRLFPVDPALGHFGYLDAMDQLFFEYTPRISNWIPNFIKPREYELKIEPVY